LIRARVLGHVRQNFFGDAIQNGGGVRRQAGGYAAVGVIDRNALLTAEFRAVVAQRHGQTKVVQHGRIQSPPEIVEVVAQAGYALLNGMRLPRRGPAGGQMRRLQAHGRQPLAEFAVQFRGHPPAFLFPLAEQAARQGFQILAVAQQGMVLRLHGLLGHFLMRDVAGIQNDSTLRIGESRPADAIQYSPGAISIAEAEFAGVPAMRISQAVVQKSADGV